MAGLVTRPLRYEQSACHYSNFTFASLTALVHFSVSPATAQLRCGSAGYGGQDWPAVAAGTTLFLVLILVFTVLLRKQLLRGITFGALRK